MGRRLDIHFSTVYIFSVGSSPPSFKFIAGGVSIALVGLPLSIELSQAQIGSFKFNPAIEQPSALLPPDEHIEQSANTSQVQIAWTIAKSTATAPRSSGFPFDDLGDGRVLLQKSFLIGR